MGLHESATLRIDAPSDVVLSFVTAVDRLPEWNPAITDVVEAPARLEQGAVWKVRIHALGQTWVSRSEVVLLDAPSGRFLYRSMTDDGNPSYANWEWQVVPDGETSRVTVSVDINPLTFWRKHLLIRLRRSALRKEMQASLVALGAAVGND